MGPQCQVFRDQHAGKTNFYFEIYRAVVSGISVCEVLLSATTDAEKITGFTAEIKHHLNIRFKILRN